MADDTTTIAIEVSGREALWRPITFTDQTGALVDLTDKALFFEVQTPWLRKALEPGAVPTERVIYLTIDETATLKMAAIDWDIQDVTIPGKEQVIGRGTITRVGITPPKGAVTE